MYEYIRIRNLILKLLLIKTRFFDEIANLTDKDRRVCLPGNAHLSTCESVMKALWNALRRHKYGATSGINMSRGAAQ